MTNIGPIRLCRPTIKLPRQGNPPIGSHQPYHLNNSRQPIRELRTEENEDGSVTTYYSNGTRKVEKKHESGDIYITRYSANDKKTSESYVENGVQTEKVYDDFERLYSNAVFQLDADGNKKSCVETKYEYYGDSSAVQKSEVFNSETGETTVTRFAEDGKTPTEFYTKKGAVTTYYDPSNPNIVLKEITDKGAFEEVRVPDKEGNLVLQEQTD